MTNRDLARLSRLRRLERIRAIAKQVAAGEAAQAEMTLARLRRVWERTRQLSEGYAAPSGSTDGAGLRQYADFLGQLQTLADRSVREVTAAQGLADGKQAELAAAERRRAAVEERADKHARKLARPAYEAALGVRRGFGTELDT